MSSHMTFLLLFLLVACSIGGLLLALFDPRVKGGSALDLRVGSLSTSGLPAKPNAAGERARKRTVEATLLEAADKQRSKAKKRPRPTLLIRMRQGDLSWSKNSYYLLSAVAGILCFVIVHTMTGLSTLPAAGFGIAAGLLCPHLYVNRRRNRRFKRFAAEFPNALDVIVRGIKAGLPLVDCIKIIAAEAQEPVRSEFKVLVDDQTMGMPVEEAVQRLPERVPLPEANYFAIVIAMQSQTGGSLSEALGGLSKVLRERKQMKSKVKAVSSEAKTSAGIIGAMPVMVTGMVYLTSPQYITLLFTSLAGNMVLAGCGVWMLIGTLVMRKMINFDI
jgi:tight adherence protein B